MHSSLHGNERPRDGERLVFVLDDEVTVGAAVCHLLTACGFVPRQFSTTVPFLTDIKRQPPELVVLDLALGESDAVEVIRHLQTMKYAGKVLLMSGRDADTLDEIAQIGKRHGLAMLAPLKKPFRAGDLKNRLAALDQVVASGGDARDAGAASEPSAASVDLGEALRNNWLELWYQPKIDLKSFLVCGAEALLRARHPEHGIVAPKDLLPPSGDPLYHPLSRFVMQRAAADWRRFSELGLSLTLAVNMPVSVVNAPDFVTIVRQSVPTDANFPGLIVEVTEDEIIRDPEWVREVATQLKLYNVWVSIDDFGSAYASLSRLNDLPCVEVKLDRSFVSNCSSDKLRHGLCQTVVDLAHRFRASACAEGVETTDELRALIAMGCDTAQGYLFAKPMPAAHFTAMMLAGTGPASFEEYMPQLAQSA